MAKKVMLNEGEIDSVKTLANHAFTALDNLFTGTYEFQTGIQDCEVCFTKRDIYALDRAFEVLSKTQNSFDATVKQRSI